MATKHYVLITCKLIINVKSSTHSMSTNLKTKKENRMGEEVAVLLEEVEKSKPYLFEIAPIHCDTDDFETPWTSPHSCWKLPVAKNCKAVVSLTIGCIALVRLVVLCRSAAMVSNKPNIHTTFPIEAVHVLGNKFLIAKAI